MSVKLVPATLVAVTFAVFLAGLEAFAPHSHSAGELASHGEEDSLGEFLVVLGIISVGAAVVFGWVVRRGLRKESAAWTALVLSVLGLLSIAVFWSGLPPVLAGGGIALGWASRHAPRSRWEAWAAVALGALVLGADLAVFLQDRAV